jgi:hypothetical protein
MSGSIAWRRGSIPTDVLDAARASEGANAKAFVDSFAGRLAELGYFVAREIYVDDRGDGYRGRVDLVAALDGQVIAIECDRRSARRKSVIKLGKYPGATGRMVVCREAA